ncbi:MAG: SDR family oxidoreductase [Nakamurella sp.]
MDLGLAGRTAVVCASTSGLGAATALALGREGAHVVVNGRRAEQAQELADAMPSAIAVAADLMAADGPETLINAAVAAFGRVDVLVLNGPGPRPARAVDIGVDDVMGAAELLVRQHVALVRLVLPAMREQGWGRILAVGSSGVTAPLPHLALSNLGRAALAGYLKTLAGEVAADGVTVNMLLPGSIATARLSSLDQLAAQQSGHSVAEVRSAAQQLIPAGRYGRPEEFGAVAAFLCGEPASYVTGTALRCDGGSVRVL